MRPPWFVAFLARRLVWAAVTTMIFVAILLVVMEVWVPYTWAGINTLSPGAEAELRELLGLDRPLPVRYAEFLVGLVRGDLGTSFSGQPVSEIVAGALPVTLTVFLVGTVLGWILGELIGRVGSWSRSFVSRSSLTTVGVASAAIFPPFLIFVLVVAFEKPLLASRDAIGLPRDSLVLWRDALTGQDGALLPTDVWWVVAMSLCAAIAAALLARAIASRYRMGLLSMLALPAAVAGAGLGIWLSGLGPHALDLMYRADMAPLSTYRPDVAITTGRSSPAMALIGVALLTFGQVSLLMRTGMDAQRNEDYVLTGRAKGLADQSIRDRHAARNAIPPVIAGSFLAFPTVLAGMMIIEFELQMQGLSSILFSAVEAQDIPVITGVLILLGLVGIALRLVADVVIATVDPRRRRAGR